MFQQHLTICLITNRRLISWGVRVSTFAPLCYINLGDIICQQETNWQGTLAASLNKTFKDTKVAYFLDGSDTTPTDIKDFISTGSTLLDLAIANKPTRWNCSW